MCGDAFKGESQPEVISELTQKLGVKVILQMENSDGEVMFEDVVSSNSNSKSSDLERVALYPHNVGLVQHRILLEETWLVGEGKL